MQWTQTWSLTCDTPGARVMAMCSPTRLARWVGRNSWPGSLLGSPFSSLSSLSVLESAGRVDFPAPSQETHMTIRHRNAV